MESIKKHWAVILAFALPLILIFGVAAAAYLPSLFLSTNYDFLYATCDENRDYYGYYCGNYLDALYTVKDGKVAVQPIDPKIDYNHDGLADAPQEHTTHIFLHDTQKNENRELTLEEAQAMKLSGLLTSPDGVSVSSFYERNGDFFLFFGGSSQYGYYLTKGNKHKRINLMNEDASYYRDNFKFLGWVVGPK